VNFYLDASIKGDARLSIFDALGKSVRMERAQSFLWNGATAGTYYYRLISDDLQETGKVVLLK
jgi:hypothetical protein